MKRLILIVAIIVLPLKWSLAMEQPNPVITRAELPGAALKWVHIAEMEFQKKQLDVDKYTILIIERNDTVTVMLRNSAIAEGVRGNAGTSPEFAVEISKKDQKVVRASFMR